VTTCVQQADGSDFVEKFVKNMLSQCFKGDFEDGFSLPSVAEKRYFKTMR
jgi:hypothetical protein